MTAFSGVIGDPQQRLTQSLSILDQKILDETSRLEVVQDMLTKKYADLNNIMTKFNQLSGYLETTFNHLTFFQKK